MKLLTVLVLIWIAPAVVALFAMTWSLWRQRSHEEVVNGAESSVAKALTCASEQKLDDEQGEQPRGSSEREHDLESVIGR